MENFKAFLHKKNVEVSAKRYGVDALGAMAQGLFASLLIGTIISTLGRQLGIDYLVTMGGYCSAMAGPAMAVSIGWALGCPPAGSVQPDRRRQRRQHPGRRRRPSGRSGGHHSGR